MRHRDTAIVSFVTGLAATLFSPVVMATTTAPLALGYDAPEECPTREAVMAEVTRLAQLADASERSVEAAIKVRLLEPERYTLELVSRFEGTPGERTLEGQSCESVVSAATLILALMLNPDAEVDAETEPEREPTRPAPASAPAPPPPTAPASGAPPAFEPTARWPLHAEAAGLVGTRWGALPDVALELGALAALGWGPFIASLDASYLPSQHHRANSSEPAGGRLWVLSGGATLGYWAPFGKLRLGPSAGVELTRLQGRGAKIAEPRTGVIYWTSLRLGFDVGLALSSDLWLHTRLSGLLPLAHPRVFLDEIGPLHRPAPWGGRASVALHYRWR